MLTLLYNALSSTVVLYFHKWINFYICNSTFGHKVAHLTRSYSNDQVKELSIFLLWLNLPGCARGFIANSFSSFWLGFAYQEPPRPIFSPISREYSGNIVFHIYRATFLVAKKTMTASILSQKAFS